MINETKNKKELASQTVNIKLTESEKIYFKGVSTLQGISITEMIKFAVKNTFPKINDIKNGNLKNLGVNIKN